MYFSEKTKYYAANDKIKLDLSQSDISELHDMCDEIINICDNYIKFIWKEIEDDIECFTDLRVAHMHWNKYYKKYIKGTTRYVNGSIMSPYLYEIDKNADDIIVSVLKICYSGTYTRLPLKDVFKERMHEKCKKYKAIMGGKYSRTFVFDANKHETMTKINSRKTITIPGFKKKIPLRGQFKGCLNDDRVKRIFIDIGCPRPGIIMYATVNLGFNKMSEKERYNYDLDGFYKLRKKGDTYNEYLKKKYCR